MNLSLKGGQVLDGTGRAAQRLDVHTQGKLQTGEPGIDSRVLDCSGLVVAPGFIDTHTHSDLAVFDDPTLAFKSLQGVCCDVLGQDGISVAPLRAEDIDEVRKQLAGLDGDPVGLEWDWRSVGDYLDRVEGAGPGVDCAYLVPHGQVRRAVLGMADRRPTEMELDAMCTVLDQGLADGAVGFSTGLIYPPCCYADTAELIALCRVVAKRDGVFVVHIRSEGDYALESVEEVLRVARESGCRLCISHMKLAGARNWTKSQSMLDLVRGALAEGVQVTADQYPYTAGSTMMGAILPPWAHAGGTVMDRLGHPETRARMRSEILSQERQPWDNFWSWGGPEDIRIAGFGSTDSPNVRYAGMNLAQAAAGKDPLEFAMDLLVAEEMGVSMVAFSQSEAVVQEIYREPWVGVCSDGLVGSWPHPRTFNAFGRVLGWLVRDLGLVEWPDAIRKMTTLPAETFRLKGLGLIAPGMRANLVAFDPEVVIDVGTYDDPKHSPKGIEHVVVGGVVVVENGQPTGARGGQVHRA
jgi:N-acyl-D-amino-acid deacylase